MNMKFDELKTTGDNEYLEQYTTNFDPDHTRLSLFDINKKEIGYFYVEKIEGNFDKADGDKKEGGSDMPDIFLMF